MKKKYAEQAAKANLYFIVGALDVVSEADTKYRTSTSEIVS